MMIIIGIEIFYVLLINIMTIRNIEFLFWKHKNSTLAAIGLPPTTRKRDLQNETVKGKLQYAKRALNIVRTLIVIITLRDSLVIVQMILFTMDQDGTPFYVGLSKALNIFLESFVDIL